MYPRHFYTFAQNHIRGWSSLYINPINVNKILDLSYHKRLFCIFDKEYKYSLKIKYDIKDLKQVHYNAVYFLTHRRHLIFFPIQTTSQFMTLRYKTEQEILNVIKEIEDKRN